MVAHYLYENWLYKHVKRSTSTIIVCIIGFIFGLPFIMNGGFYLFDLVDSCTTVISTFTILLLEAFLVSRYIGTDVLQEINSNKTGKMIPEYVLISIRFISPVALSLLLFLAVEDLVI
jgi:SNF family Na+-dependent transporter